MAASPYLTSFDFKCNSFEDLPKVMEEEVGFKVLPHHIWSINITPFEIRRLSVTLTICHYNSLLERQKSN